MEEAKKLAIERSKSYYKEIRLDRFLLIQFYLVTYLITIALFKIIKAPIFMLIAISIIISILVLVQITKNFITDTKLKLSKQRFAEVKEFMETKQIDGSYTCCYVSEDLDNSRLVLVQQHNTRKQLFCKGDFIAYANNHGVCVINYMAKN